tara:strand:+ start:16 stop:579 length:564 start_codon:yes stop_codon:yes gene_type:complete
MATLFVDKVDPQSGTSLEIGSSGDTITIPSGATITNSGTATGFGGANTPYFYARRTSTQTMSNSTNTAVQFDTEDFDTGSEYNTSNYRFVPANGSTYLIHGQLKIGTSVTATLQEARTLLFKNGSEVLEMRNDTYTNGSQFMSPSLSKIVTGNGSDYYQIYAHIYVVGGATPSIRAGSFFTAFKLIG